MQSPPFPVTLTYLLQLSFQPLYNPYTSTDKTHKNKVYIN